MQRIERNGLIWYAFAGPGRDFVREAGQPACSRHACSRRAGFTHGCFTRLGGVSEGQWSTLNLGSTVGDDPRAVQENHRRIFDVFGITRAQVVSPFQVHGCNVVRVGARDGGMVIPATDALITDTPGLALLLRFADCVPVLFYDPVRHAVGLAHAGWRGVAAGVAVATVQAMAAAFGSRPEDVWAGIGPAIGPQHYTVGAEVVDAIQAVVPAGVQAATYCEERWTMDLPAALEAQLRAVGVTQVEQSGLCTASRVDEWYSHRAEEGRTGRFGVLVMLDRQ